MNIYISGISGTGMGPLALMAKDAGHNVYGSDLAEGPIAHELRQHNITFQIGPQDGSFFQQIQAQSPIDWFVYTSALPPDHPELQLAIDSGIRTSKRDQLIAHLVDELQLKMVAVAGTHGKTTTTAMLIWAATRLGLPASYLVGTTLPFAPAGHYSHNDKFFIYEADEYDRNFLFFHPWLSLVTTVTYDHPDIYPTPTDYQAAFDQFASQSQTVINGGKVDSGFTLPGELRREDATTALKALTLMSPTADSDQIIKILNDFPGAGRRFERLMTGVYSDYAHHPEEISATIKMAREAATLQGLKGVVAVYQPHQNTRQHQVRSGYQNAFAGVSKLYWLPTYLTREDPTLPILTPTDFISDLQLPGNFSDGSPIAEPATTNDQLATKLRQLHAEGYLILLLTAGPADAWYRQVFQTPTFVV